MYYYFMTDQPRPLINPKTQDNQEIVEHLLVNTERQYTEAAHAEIFSRLIATIQNFNTKAEKIEKVMLTLAIYKSSKNRENNTPVGSSNPSR